jgi:cytochrome c-type biogenesis protein CcmE
MKADFRFFSLFVVFIVGAFVMMYFATTQTSSKVLVPSQIIADSHKNLARVRVAGRVSSDDIAYQTDPDFKLTFTMVDRPNDKKEGEMAGSTSVNSTDTNLSLVTEQSPSSRAVLPKLKVIFEDIKPDMFTNGRDILVDGNLEDGVLIATTVLTQCPSKYEPAEPTK